MPTPNYIQLRASIRLARRIASRVDPNATVSPLDEIKIRSYIILAHAAIEEFFEETSKSIAVRAVDLLRNQNSVSLSLLALVSHYKSKFPEIFVSPPPAYQLRQQLLPIAQECLQKHIEKIDDNHGIKIKSVNGLMFPIGIEFDRLAPGVAGSLETFGTKRGNVAHNMGIRTVETKSSIDSDLSGILTHLKSLDEFASSHCLGEVQFI